MRASRWANDANGANKILKINDLIRVIRSIRVIRDKDLFHDYSDDANGKNAVRLAKPDIHTIPNKEARDETTTPSIEARNSVS